MHGYKDMYIMKPAGGSQGRGIRMIGKKDQVRKEKQQILV